MSREEKYYTDKLVGKLIRVDCVDWLGNYTGNDGYQKIIDFSIESEGEESFENYVITTERITPSGRIYSEMVFENPYQDQADQLINDEWAYVKVKHGAYKGRKHIACLFH